MILQFEEEFHGEAKIRVVGVGGAGGNAVNTMVEAGLQGVEFLAVNTDAQALEASIAGHRIQVGSKVTRGLGSGGDPRVGARAIEEDHAAVAEALSGSDMVFVTAGMGGGTGTGAAPTVARIARELGALVVGIVTVPFRFEGRRRLDQAKEGLEELRNEVDTLIAIPNDRLLKVAGKDMSLKNAFQMADSVLLDATRGISSLITVPGLVNLDFADVRSVMEGMGAAIMGTGSARGDNRASEAARAALHSPLLEDVEIAGARGVLVNITGNEDLSLFEVGEVTSLVQEAVGDNANLIFGAVIDEEAGEELTVTVIATGFGESPRRRQATPLASAQANAATASLRDLGGTLDRPAAAAAPAAQEEIAPPPPAREATPEPARPAAAFAPKPPPAEPVHRLREMQAEGPDRNTPATPAPPTPPSAPSTGSVFDRMGQGTRPTEEGRSRGRDEYEKPAFLRRLRD